MHWWDTKAVVEDLRNGKIDEFTKLKYFLATVILEGLPFGVYLGPTVNTRGITTLLFLVSIMITIIGIIHCQEANRRADNRRFIERFFCLSLPVALKLELVLFIILVTSKIIIVLSSTTKATANNISVVTLILTGISFQILFFQRLGIYFSKFANVNSSVAETAGAHATGKQIYLWDIKKLIKKLRESQISEKAKSNYLLVNLIFGSGMFYSFYCPHIKLEDFTLPHTINILLLFSNLVGIAIVLGGTLLCYKANIKGDGLEFLDRLICLALPVKIKLGVFLLIPLVLFGTLCTGIYTVAGYDVSLPRLIVFFDIVVVFISIMYYLLLWSYFDEVSGADDLTRQFQSKIT